MGVILVDDAVRKPWRPEKYCAKAEGCGPEIFPGHHLVQAVDTAATDNGLVGHLFCGGQTSTSYILDGATGHPANQAVLGERRLPFLVNLVPGDSVYQIEGLDVLAE